MSDLHEDGRRPPRRRDGGREPFDWLESVEWLEPGADGAAADEAIVAEFGVELVLVERLRKLDWPRPSAELRRRCLERIVAHVEGIRDPAGEGTRGADGRGPGSVPRLERRIQRHPATRLLAPRRPALIFSGRRTSAAAL